MRRRDFLAIASGAVASPWIAQAQQAALRQIGVEMLYEEGNSEGKILLAAFQDALAKLGWTDGRNVGITVYWTGTDPGHIEQATRAVVASRPDVILSSSSPTTLSLLRQTRTIPIVFAQVVDPVAQGFVASLARPAGNATGLANFEPAMAGKWIELLKELLPRMTRVAIPFNPTAAPYADIYLKSFNSIAPSFGVKVVAPTVADLPALESFCAAQSQDPDVGIIPMPSGFASGHVEQITAIMARHRLPSLYVIRAYAKAGGLLSYRNDINDNFRKAASFVDKILNGQKPGDLPAQFPTKFELAINLKTAKDLGLTVPPSLLATADEVIE